MERLESPELYNFLGACPADEVTALAELMARTYGNKMLSVTTVHVPRSLRERRMRGHALIPDIVTDIANQGSHSLGKTLSYEDCVRWIGGRHRIDAAGTAPVVEIERLVLEKYDINAISKAEFSAFKDKGSASLARRASWLSMPGMVEYALSANWGITTFIMLKIAIMRLRNRALVYGNLLED
ncbi:hypothetical protein [Acidocella sp.]|uniref:hypothetical protein n=1 Tax=Acidocella sp. TaxID=50710 RepID=UPI003D05CBD3